MHEIEHISHYYTQGRSSILLDILVGPSTCSHVSLAGTSTQPEFEFHFILNQDFKQNSFYFRVEAKTTEKGLG